MVTSLETDADPFQDPGKFMMDSGAVMSRIRVLYLGNPRCSQCFCFLQCVGSTHV